MSTPRPTPGSEPDADPATTPAGDLAPVEVALAPALRLRLLGGGLTAIGVVVVVVVLLDSLVGLPTAVSVTLVALAGLAVLALALTVGPRRWVLRLDADGYRVRALRSAQARSARWTDVLDLQATTVAGNRCAVMRLRDGRTTTLPVDVLEGDADDLARTLAEHLDRGHGYRRLR